MTAANRQNRFEEKTHGGAQAVRANPEQMLRRSVLSCLLWENEFYEEGESIARRIDTLSATVSPDALAALAVEARGQFNLRHVPLKLALNLLPKTKGSGRAGEVIADVIQRPDELAEILSIYWKDGRKPLAAQLKKGLARAFTKFDAYQLAKYNRDNVVKLRDVLFLSHAKPADGEQAATWAKLVDGTLEAPDTWEVALSGGADKKEAFTRLLSENRLGYLALLRNLRNMEQAGVDRALIEDAIAARRGAQRVLPFRFFAAAREAPSFERALDAAMVAGFAQLPKLEGKTIIVLDVSGSMGAGLGGRSTMTRLDAGAALAAVVAGSCENPVVYATAGSDYKRVHATKRLPSREGMALRDAFMASYRELGGGGIFLKPMLDFIKEKEGEADRIVVITDEQDCTVGDRDRPGLAAPFGSKANYLLNVASYRNGIGYGQWTHIDGFSDQVVRYMIESENA